MIRSAVDSVFNSAFEAPHVAPSNVATSPKIAATEARPPLKRRAPIGPVFAYHVADPMIGELMRDHQR